MGKGILGIGVDIEDISRFDNFAYKYKIEKNKIFTAKEFEYCILQTNSAQHFAARFAAKEAVIKALGSFKKEVRLNYNEIEVRNSPNGVPFVKIQGDSAGLNIQLSLSHCSDKAIAFVIIF